MRLLSRFRRPKTVAIPRPGPMVGPTMLQLYDGTGRPIGDPVRYVPGEATLFNDPTTFNLAVHGISTVRMYTADKPSEEDKGVSITFEHDRSPEALAANEIRTTVHVHRTEQ